MYAPTQPVGGNVRFQSQMPHSAAHGRGDLLTPTRQNGYGQSPFRNSLASGSHFDTTANVNPFTPRVDRGMSAASSRTLARRNTTLGTTTRIDRSGSYQGQAPSISVTDSSMQGTQSSTLNPGAEYPALGGIGGWPASSASATNHSAGAVVASAGVVGDNAGASDSGSKSSFSRPKSPASRSASPHQNRKKLPSFLLASAPAPKSPGASSPYPPDTARTGRSTATSSAFAIPSAKSPAQAPLSSRPVSPRVPRRLSGFGSNDMLSGAYRSSMVPASGRAAGPASSLDDAPPIVTLDEIDMESPDVFAHDGGDIVANDPDADVFAMHPEDTFNNDRRREHNYIDGADPADSEQDYEDVKIRSIVVSDLPPNSESSTLNYFRSFGEILAFSTMPAAGDSLALLFSEPWQARQALSQGDRNGRILLDGRVLVRVDWADAQCTSVLFKKVFPRRPLPKSAAPPPTESFSFAEAVYAQSPRKRPASLAQQQVGSRIDSIRDSETRGRAAGGSPFKHQRIMPRSSAGPATTSMAASGSISGSALAPKVTVPPKPRNGLLQSALDILFGW
ncbi:hypothetical protein H4R20_000316 [Coemansia guatemalensis]|uniref:RRM Nup35-type domain-containing protein n=1 Tax=Coemansia guatemalensis TaxID=2761395 RepID=A0A9W8I1E1_9FUNG|nr:hypothetical protein H4R20_000316 [Coemansia guatemalensis]